MLCQPTHFSLGFETGKLYKAFKILKYLCYSKNSPYMMKPPNANTCVLLIAHKQYNKRPINGHITGRQKPTRQKNVMTGKEDMH